MEALRQGPQLVVGTRGRIHDLIQRRVLHTEEMKLFIVDNANEVLSVSLVQKSLLIYIGQDREQRLDNVLARFRGATLRNLRLPS
jgi:superfamily II DNA/RNA helicase